MILADEKDLRGISVGGQDLLDCLTKEESEEYHREEGKGKILYRKGKVVYKSKASRCGKIRQWTKKEITMYQELKDCKSVSQMVITLLLIEGKISVSNAEEALRDHPKKPGNRGIAQGISRIYKKLEFLLEKQYKGHKVFYKFVRDEYMNFTFQDLYLVYRSKMTIDDLLSKYQIKPLGDDINDDTVIMQDIVDLDRKIEVLTNYLNLLEKAINKQEEPKGQRLDIHFYLHFGKED